MVQDSWLGGVRMWEMLMAQKGYLVYVQDNRGTSNQGAEFERAINRQCGQAEMADQMAGLRRLMEKPYVDKDRIGVHGWSYGGFMTISLITNYPDVFKVAVAGGPVIDWKWYEIMYGERYMDTPQENPEGYEATSLLNKAKNLQGRLLVIQGAEDNTVVPQHSTEFIERCINNYRQVDYFAYPHHEHNVLGRERLHLYQKMFQYYEDFLK
jgi:dipeptidyl-peptidase-4